MTPQQLFAITNPCANPGAPDPRAFRFERLGKSHQLRCALTFNR